MKKIISFSNHVKSRIKLFFFVKTIKIKKYVLLKIFHHRLRYQKKKLIGIISIKTVFIIDAYICHIMHKIINTNNINMII